MQDFKKMKNVIILVAILIIILTIILIAVKNNSKEAQSEEESSNESIDYSKVETHKVTETLQFYSVSQCVQNYFDLVNIDNPDYYGQDETGKRVRMIDEQQAKQNLYNLLSENYKKENEITVDNVTKYVSQINQKVIFTPINMYVLQGENADKYLVYGIVEDMSYNKIRDIYIFVNKDEAHSTFSIEEINEEYSDIEKIKINNENLSITENENNTYANPSITDEYIAEQQFNIYKQIILGDQELAYKFLNEEYRNKRFEDYNDFKKYVAEKKVDIVKSNAEKYSINENDNYKEYVCLDDSGNYYVFRIDNQLNYEVMLDTYTVDLLKFTEKYTKASEEEKVVLNINKIFTAIDAKDYKYVYSKLAESFKNNYFNNESDLQKYLNDNLFEKNNVSYEEYAREGELYTYKVYITDNNNTEDSKQVKMNIVMQLKEGTDFVMSFSIEK